MSSHLERSRDIRSSFFCAQCVLLVTPVSHLDISQASSSSGIPTVFWFSEWEEQKFVRPWVLSVLFKRTTVVEVRPSPPPPKKKQKTKNKKKSNSSKKRSYRLSFAFGSNHRKYQNWRLLFFHMAIKIRLF